MKDEEKARGRGMKVERFSYAARHFAFRAGGQNRFAVAACALIVALCAWSCAPRAEEGQAPGAAELLVAAAADLAPAFAELGRSFERETGIKVVFSFGSTGTLAQQIEQGAPVDLFAAANVAYVEGLERQGLIIPETKALYARGRITIWTRRAGGLRLERLADLAHPEIRRIAIANPEHAPYGMAAREALQAAGLWETLQSKLVFGENVRQTLQYAESGNADAAIVALSLSIQSDGQWTLIPEELHRPLAQALAVIRGARHEQSARRFAAYINSQQGRSVMQRYGFVLPGETPAR